MDEWSKDEAIARISALERALRTLKAELAGCREDARHTAQDLGERLKELTCLYEVASLSQSPTGPLKEVIEGIMRSLMRAYQYPDIACMRVIVEGEAYYSEGFRETRWRQSAEVAQENQAIGTMDIFYLQERPPADEGPFLDEERHLLETAASLLARHLRSRGEQEALHRREQEFRTLAENSTDVISRFDRALRRIYANPAVETLLGSPPSTVLGKTNRELGLPDDFTDPWDRCLMQVFTTGQMRTVEEVAAPKGDRVFESRLVPEFGPDGSVETLLAISRDVTERKRAEQALRESEARYRRKMTELEVIYRHAPVGLSVVDTQLRFLRINERLAAINGLPVEAHIGKTCHEILPGIIDQIEAIIHRILESGEPMLDVQLQGETPAHPGVLRIWNTQWLPLKDSEGGIWGFNIVVEEITERKQTEEALLESERKYRALVESLYEGIWLLDQDNNTTFVNTRMAEMLGYPMEEMLGKSLFAFLDEQAMEVARLSLAQGRSGVRGEHEFVFRRKNGEPICTHVSTTFLYDEHGRYRGILAGVIDITARKQAEEDLNRRRQEFEALAERSPDVIARVDRSLRTSYINRAVERLTHHPREWFVGKTVAELGLMAQDRALRDFLQKVFDSGGEQVMEHESPTAEGERYFHARMTPEFGPDGKVASVLVVDRDITELKHAQFALERLTLEDPVTGIPNRRYLEQFVARDWGREVRHKQPVAVIMADIDHFKAYNDHYGHQRGDECLRQVAQTLKIHLRRPTDFLVRYGGEEFAVILLETDLPAAMQLAQKMHKAIADLKLPHETSPVAPVVTVSLGVAAAPAHEQSFSQLFQVADQALYRAKNEGRNRVEMGCPT